MLKPLFFTLLLISVIEAPAQTLGGSSVFNFLKLPNTPQLTALGGINISNITQDVGMSFHNPGLLKEDMHGHVNAVFNNMYAGIKHISLMGAYRSNRWNTNFAAGIHYLNYGDIRQTDASGNEFGTFRAGDYTVQVTASRKYMDRWNYGVAVKYIHSSYGIYRSNGVAMDAGVTYYDSSGLWQAALAMKNMGFQLMTYAGTQADNLPFDLQIGITKRLKKAPVQFSATAHHLHQFNIRYNDSVFNNENGFNNISEGHFLDQVFRHLVFGVQVFAGERLELSAGYNYLRRKELSIDQSANGLTGFSMGVGVLFKKLQLRYARGYYQNNTGYNQFGLSLVFH